MSKIMFFDIETTPNVVYSWRVGTKITILPENIVQERKIICICYKYEGEKKIHSLEWDSKHCDKAMLKEFGELLRDCDVAIGHNGDRFDIPWVKTRNMLHKLPPITNLLSVDTLKLSRSNFNFNSNKLSYIADYLGLSKKGNPGGMQTWIDLMNGQKAAMARMVKYCKQDVTVLEDVYNTIKPYVNHLPFSNAVLKGGKREDCPMCASKENTRYGTITNKIGKYQKYKCASCAHIFKDSRKM